MREWRRKNPEKARANDARDYERHQDVRRANQKARSAQERIDHPERVRTRQRRHQAEQRTKLRALVAEAKDSPCKVCGVKFPPRAMDLHHRDPSTKLFNFGHFSRVSALPGTTREETFRLELAKCDVLCSNCHRVHHDD